VHTCIVVHHCSLENSLKGQVTKSKNPYPPLGGRGSPKQEDENTNNP